MLATPLTNAARCLVCFQLVLSYPLVCFPGRDSMMSLWHSLILHYPTSYATTHHPLKLLPLPTHTSSHIELVNSPLINSNNKSTSMKNQNEVVRKPSFSAVDNGDNDDNEIDNNNNEINHNNNENNEDTEISNSTGENGITTTKNDSKEEINTNRKFIISTVSYLNTFFTIYYFIFNHQI